MNIAAIDLNLLLVLDLLLRERSVGAVARALGVTSPAVSNALGRLRDVFDDPLFVRSGRGIEPTPFALDLAPDLERAIATLQRVVARPKAVRPQDVTRAFTLACTDVDQLCTVPLLAERMAAVMPRAGLHVISVDTLQAGGGLASGVADAVIAPLQAKDTGEYRRALYRDRAAVVVRRDHPVLRRRCTARIFNALRHVDTRVALGRAGVGHRMAERALAAAGLQRRVALTVPTFMAAALVASTTDLAASLPRRLAERFSDTLGLAVFELPGVTLALELVLVWHARSHADPAAAMFRELVVEASGTVQGRP